MIEKIKKVSNPLTIIAFFAALAEVNGTIVFNLVPAELKELFLWFIISFPVLLVVLFFFTLNFNPRVIYAPSDFNNEDNYMKALTLSSKKFEAEQVAVVESSKNKKDNIEVLKKEDWKNISGEIFSLDAGKQLELANDTYKTLLQALNTYMEQKVFYFFSYG